MIITILTLKIHEPWANEIIFIIIYRYKLYLYYSLYNYLVRNIIRNLAARRYIPWPWIKNRGAWIGDNPIYCWHHHYTGISLCLSEQWTSDSLPAVLGLICFLNVNQLILALVSFVFLSARLHSLSWWLEKSTLSPRTSWANPKPKIFPLLNSKSQLSRMEVSLRVQLENSA